MSKVFCPALGIPQVKQQFETLVSNVGESEAYALWNHYKGVLPESLTTPFNQEDLGKKDSELYDKSKESNKFIKQGISELFESNSELANIGTQQQYSQYLDSIFPDSKVKDIVYHRSPEKISDSGFDKSKTKEINGNRFYFSPLNTGRYGQHVTQAILNIKNLAKPYDKDFMDDVNKNHPEYTEGKSKWFYLPAQIYVNAIKYGYDGVYAFEGTNDDEFSVYEPDQIHILGSKQDIEGFKDFVQGKQFQKLTVEEKAKTIEQVTREHRSITALKDLSAKLAHRIGGTVAFQNHPNADWKGYNQGMKSVLNEAYMTPDTPFHEILAHPIIKAIKNRNLNKVKTDNYNVGEFIYKGDIYKTEKDIFGYSYKNGKEISDSEFDSILTQYLKEGESTELYQSLLKELETGRGKEVFEQVKRDYKYRYNIEKTNSEYGNYKINSSESGARYFDTYEEAQEALEKYAGSKYTIEEQQNEAIVTLLGLMAADKLDAKKDATLISKLKELWKQISDFVKSLLRQDGIKIDELPITTTLNDLAEIMGYGNNKIILPGYKVEYSTPLGNKYDTSEEVNNEIKGLADANVEVDLSGVKINLRKQVKNSNEIPVNKFVDEFDNTTYNKKDDKWYIGDTNRVMLDDDILTLWNSNLSHNYINKAGVEGFLEKNKEYEQSKEIIEQWKKENNIQYDPEEVYSRGQGFYSSIGAYSNLELDLLLKNLIQHIEDNKKAGGEFTISAFTKPIGKRLKHIEGTGDRVRFVIYPQSEHIKWAAPTDVYSGSVWDAHEKVSKDKKSELLGVSFTKAPALRNINEVSPNLADIIDNLSHVHNELGIELTTNNFRIEYDDNIDYSTKKLIDNINKILDDKYGKLIKPEISVSDKKEITFNVVEYDLGSGESSIIYNTPSKENADNFIKEQISKFGLINKFGVSGNYYKIEEKTIQQGKQPIQTRENTTSIESVRSKLGINTPNNFRHEDFSIGDVVTIEGIEGEYKIYEYEDSEGEIGVGTTEVFYNLEPVDESTLFDPETNPEGTGRPYFRVPTSKMKKVSNVKEKEYINQAEINLKVAALKEVARKYPRNLITSKVVPINPNMVDNSEIQYSKVSSKETRTNKEIKSALSNKQVNDVLQSMLAEGDKLTSRDVLHILSFKTKDKDLLNTFKFLDHSTFKVTILDNFDRETLYNNEALMSYDPDLSETTSVNTNAFIVNGHIFLSKEHIDNKPQEFLSDFLHEVVHAYTIKLYETDREFNAEVNFLYHQALAKYLLQTEGGLFTDHYGFKNGKEFLSEIFSNEKFRKTINNLEDNRSFFRKLWDLIVKFITKGKLNANKDFELTQKTLDLITTAVNISKYTTFNPKDYSYLQNGSKVFNKSYLNAKESKQENTLKKQNLFSVKPKGDKDAKAKAKASLANKFIGFGEGLPGSSTELYRQQTGIYSNPGEYNSKDVIFVSIPGKRGDSQIRGAQQDKTIKEALRAISAGAILITDNKAYIESSDYNTGEQRLYKNLEHLGYNYSEQTVDGHVLGVWRNLDFHTTASKLTVEQELSTGDNFFNNTLNTPVDDLQKYINSKKKEIFNADFPDESKKATKLEEFMSLKNINHLDKQIVANMMADELSTVLDILTKDGDPELVEYYFDDLVSTFNINEKEVAMLKELHGNENIRLKAINVLGLGKILSMVQQRLQGYTSPEISQGVTLSGAERMHYDNILQDVVSDIEEGYFKQFLEIAKTRIRKSEGIIINVDEKTFAIEELEKEDVTEAQPDPEVNDNIIEDELVFEDNWVTSYLQRSFVGNLSFSIRNKFTRIPILDRDGYNEVNKFGYPVYYNEKEIFNKLMEIVYRYTNSDDQVAALRAEQDKYRWIPTVINLIESDPSFKTDCFVNFRKDFIRYYKSYQATQAKKGMLSSVVNSTDVMDSFIDDIKSLARSKSIDLYEVKEVKESDKLNDNVPIGVNNKELNRLRKLLKGLDRNSSSLSAETSFNDFSEYEDEVYGKQGSDDYNGVFNDLLEILHSIGLININSDLLEKALFANLKLSDSTLIKEKLPFYRLKKALSNLLNSTYGRAIPPTGVLDYDNHVQSIYDYNHIFDLFNDHINTINESMVYEEGKCYYSYAAPNYLNRLINKISNSSPQEFIDWVEQHYLKSVIHGSFFNPESEHYFVKGFSSWIQSMYVEAKRSLNTNQNTKDTYRGKFKFDTFLSHKSNRYGKAKEFTDMTDYEYLECVIFNYINVIDKRNKNLTRFLMPIMADKSVNGFITYKKVTGEKATEIISKKLYSVFMQEVDRIYTVAQRHKDRNNPNLKPITNWDADFSSPKLSFNKGDSFHFLPVFNQYLTGIYDENPDNSITRVLKSLIDTVNNPTNPSNIAEELEEIKDEVINIITKTLDQEFEAWIGVLEKEGYFKDLSSSLFSNKTSDEVTDILKEFFYNNYYANSQILQLTITDLAFYKDWDDVQKRLAQLRAPGLAYDIQARNKYDENKLFTEDGLQKSMMMTDFLGEAREFSEIERIFKNEEQRLISALEDKYKVLLTDSASVAKSKRDIVKKITKNIKAELEDKLNDYRKVNSTDGQSIISINYLKKTEGCLNRWSADKQRLFNKIEEALKSSSFEEMLNKINALDYNEFGVVFETRKPFSYTQINVSTITELTNIDGSQKLIKKGYQTKNAETILLDIYGLLKSGNRFAVGLMKFMYDNDIDIIHTGSTVKTGQQGVIDHTRFNSGEELLNELYRLTNDKNSLDYQNHVTQIPMEDVALQVETPSKFENKQQEIGGQEEKLLFEGVDENTVFNFQGEKISGKDLQKLYELALATKVELSKNSLFEEIGLTEQVRKDMSTAGINFNDTSTMTTANTGMSEEELAITKERIEKSKIAINVKLSKKLISEMVESDRFSYDLVMAAQLNSNGDFIVPLNDELQFDRIQQTINSLIRKTITKQKTAGAQLIQVSDGIRKGSVELEQALKIEFDEDADGNKHIKYFEAELPAYHEEFYKDFIDENGYLRTDWMPEELLAGVAYRIPTEGFCSMIPIKIVRFSNKLNGGLIKLPAAITTITGADFDIDKLFLMFPSIKVSKNLRNKYNKDYEFSYEYLQAIKDKSGTSYYVKMNEYIRDGRIIEKAKTFSDIENYLRNQKKFSELQKVRGIYNEFLNHEGLVSSKYSLPSIEFGASLIKDLASDPVTAKQAIFNKLKDDADGQIKLSNLIFEINKTVLTSSNNVFNTLNVSGFPNLKRYANIVQIAESNSAYSAQDLEELSNSELKKLAKINAPKRTYISPVTQAYIFKRNSVGSKLIGIGANGNVSQAMLQHYNIKVNVNHVLNNNPLIPALNELRLNGISFENLIKTDKEGIAYMEFSNTYSLDGVTRISNKIREILAAAVDAAKDPLLDSINIDKLTVTVLESILRFGFDFDAAIYLLNQPLIKQFVKSYNNASAKKSINVFTYLKKFLTDQNQYNTYLTTKFNSDLLVEDLARNIGKPIITQGDMSDQLQALKFFIAMVAFSTDLRIVNSMAKTDSVAMGVGSKVVDSLAKYNEIEQFKLRCIEGNSYFHKDTAELLNEKNAKHSPLLATHYNSNREAIKYIFGYINPMYYNEFSKVMNLLQKQVKEPLSGKVISKLQQDFALFKMLLMDADGMFTDDLSNETVNSRRVLKGNKKLTKYYTIQIIEDFAKTINALKEDPSFANNLFIKNLQVNAAFKNSKLNILSINSFGLSAEDKQAMAAGWTDLILSPVKVLANGYTTRQFGLDLIAHSIYKNGFSFGNKSFLYLLGTEVKARLPKYINYLRTSANMEIKSTPLVDYYQEFINLFKRHNSDIPGLVESYKKDELGIISGSHNKDGDYQYFKTSRRLPSIIKFNNLLYQHMGNNMYFFVTPLGLNGVGKEYTSDMIPSEGHTKDSIYLVNSKQRDEFTNMIYEENSPQPTEPDEEEQEIISLITQYSTISDISERRKAFTSLLNNTTNPNHIALIEKAIEKYC